MSPFDPHGQASDQSFPSASPTNHVARSSSMPEPCAESQPEMQPIPEIMVYGTSWCGDCRRARRVFAALNVDYRYVDIEHDEAATQLVMRLNGGMQSVPTIIFPNGERLVEPRNSELEARLRFYAAS